MNSALFDRLDVMQSWVHRRRWWIRLATALILVPLIWPFVSSRWNAQAQQITSLLNSTAILDSSLTYPPPEVDNTPALTKALQALPPDPVLAVPTSAPAGHEWVWWDDYRKRQGTEISSPWPRNQPSTPFFDITEALCGEWIPQRYHLKEIINYLELPATQTALDDLVSMADRPHCLTEASVPGSLAAFRRGIKMLTARARYHLAEHQDFEPAVRDIEAVLHLAGGMADNELLIRFLVAIACHNLALEEIRYWPEEFSLKPDQLKRLATMLDQHPFDCRTEWKRAMQGEMRWARSLLDAIYARTPDGNGFQVLARSLDTEQRPWVLGALNLLSPLFEDRRAAEKLLNLSEERISYLSELPTPELLRLENTPAPSQYRPVVGAHWYYLGLPVGDLGGSYSRSLILSIQTQIRDDLSATVIALARYRLDHGQYPAQLPLLVPKYLPETPVDLFAEHPLQYKFDQAGDYLLYSVGDDGQDNNGQKFRVDGLWDLVADRRRGEPCSEWVLVPQDSGGGREEP